MDPGDYRLAPTQNLVGHAAPVNAVRIGQKSGRIVVTGGDDKRVNVWRMGVTEPVLTLSGHASAVESLAIDWPEELVVAGGSSGTIKLWDLEQNKAIRTLTGHKAGIPTLEFHPFGDFFASGSADTTVKIWDVRRKGCIQTYMGQADAVTALRITPNGRWIATADAGGRVRLWDMTAGKLLRAFEPPTAPGSPAAPVTALAFNPAEFMMAVCDAAQTLALYDLQTFEPLASVASGPAGGPAAGVLADFDADGTVVLLASSRGVDVWSWDPPQRLDHVPARTGTVADLRVLPDDGQLVLATRQQSVVALYSAALASLAPFRDGEEDEGDAAPQSRPLPLAPQSPPTPPLPPQTPPLPAYQQPTLPQAPPQQPPQQAPQAPQHHNQQTTARPPQPQNTPQRTAPVKLVPSEASLLANLGLAGTSTGKPQGDERPLDYDLNSLVHATAAHSDIQERLATLPDPLPEQTLRGSAAPPQSEDDVCAAVSARHASVASLMAHRLAHLRQLRADWAALGAAATTGAVSSATGLPTIGHSPAPPQAQLRRFLDALRDHWEQYGDATVIVEVLKILNLRPRLLSLDAASQLLALSASVLTVSPLYDHARVARHTCHLLLRSFGDVARTTLAAAKGNATMALEERAEKCRAFASGLGELHRAAALTVARVRQSHADRSTGYIKLLQELLQELDGSGLLSGGA